mgnify:CR=1 FL=1
MKIKELKKEIKGVFKPPIKEYYIGKLAYGTPYFYPWNFHETIISIRKLKLRTEEDRNDFIETYSHLKDDLRAKFSNIPMVRRRKYHVIRLFNNYYFIQWGWPISINNINLGWKWKFNSIRYEWFPMFQINFFLWQFVIKWRSPDKDDDSYYEQILWWLKGSDKDIDKARNTWGWTKDGISTWKNEYLL